jgi:AbrB family looped-hinge helix DNA binding protein
MRVTAKGQVTIPHHIRELAGIHPNTEVEFQYENGRVWLTTVQPDENKTRGQLLVERLRGTATANLDLTTDEIMTMTRGED